MKGSVQKKELNFVGPIFKWLVTVCSLALGVIVLLLALKGEFEDPYMQVVLLLLAIPYIFYGLTRDAGINGLAEMYRYLGVKNRDAVLGLSNVPIYLLLSFVAITIFFVGKYNVTFLLNLANITFMVPFISGLILAIIRRDKKSQKKRIKSR